MPRLDNESLRKLKILVQKLKGRYMPDPQPPGPLNDLRTLPGTLEQGKGELPRYFAEKHIGEWLGKPNSIKFINDPVGRAFYRALEKKARDLMGPNLINQFPQLDENELHYYTSVPGALKPRGLNVEPLMEGIQKPYTLAPNVPLHFTPRPPLGGISQLKKIAQDLEEKNYQLKKMREEQYKKFPWSREHDLDTLEEMYKDQPNVEVLRPPPPEEDEFARGGSIDPFYEDAPGFKRRGFVEFRKLWDMASGKLPVDETLAIARELRAEGQSIPSKLAAELAYGPAVKNTAPYMHSIRDWNPEMSGNDFDALSDVYFPGMRSADDVFLKSLWEKYHMPTGEFGKMYRSLELPYTSYPSGFQLSNRTIAMASQDPYIGKMYAQSGPGTAGLHPVMFDIDVPKGSLVMPRPNIFHSEYLLHPDSLFEVTGPPTKVKSNSRFPGVPDIVKIPARYMENKAAGGQVGNFDLTPDQYKHYGETGPEHAFFPNRQLPAPGPFYHDAPPVAAPRRGGSSGLGTLGTIGAVAAAGYGAKKLYDLYQNDAKRTAQTLKAVNEYGTPDYSNLDWTGSGVGQSPADLNLGTPGQIMDPYAGNIQMEDYGDELGNMPMPTAQYDATLWDKAKNFGSGIGSAFDVYGGVQRGDVGGYGQALKGLGKLSDVSGIGSDYSGMLGQTGAGLSGVAGIYGGIQQGGVQGYGSAAINAAQTARQFGMLGEGAGAVAGKAVPLVGGALAAYGAYNAAKTGDTRGAATQGAMAGASIGSVIPGIGTVVGGVIGAAVGAIGAQFGDKEQKSEMAYGEHKKLAGDENIRGWTSDQAGGAMFEALKSHTKSGNINKFQDVSQLYTALGITKDAHKNVKQATQKMQGFIGDTIKTAMQTHNITPEQLRSMDGQQFYYKVVAPAMSAKIGEVTGNQNNAWSQDFSGSKSELQGMFADYTDYMMAHWGENPAYGGTQTAAKPQAVVRRPARVALRATGGSIGDNMRGPLSQLQARRPQEDPSSYYKYGSPPPQPMPPQGMPQMPPQMPPQVAQMPQVQRAMGGGPNFGYNRGTSVTSLVNGPGTGRSDEIPARLSDGEYVIDAETVALLGDGSTDEGARRLDALRKKLRMHKGKNLAKGKFSSKAKTPEQYLKSR